jgi:hypothetical protein
MNVHNLDREEMESLYDLLGKMLNKDEVKKEPLEKMIDEIMDEFNFATVHKTMVALDWKWASSKNYIPSMDELRDQAIYLLRGAAKARLGDYKDTHWELGVIHGTGGFQATAFCDKNKTRITGLDLKFVVAEWDEGDNEE